MDNNSEGGQGGKAYKDKLEYSRADFDLMRQAARKRWGVPDALKTLAMHEAYKILVDSDSAPRDRVSAAKLIADVDKIDQADEKLDLDKAKFEYDKNGPTEVKDDFDVDLSKTENDLPSEANGTAG